MILVTGGCRSGKSAFAEKLVTGDGHGPWLYVATSRITDEEMALRVEKHRQRREKDWETFEGYSGLAQSLSEKDGRKYRGILVDSVTAMVTNLLFDFIGDVDWESFSFETVDYRAAQDKILDEFRALCRRGEGAPLVFVTDEIGLGVVPETSLGRNFRDILGTVNQYLAGVCGSVYFVISGIPVQIKGGTGEDKR